ncbi:MAG: hypothetical protein U0796_20760 [Gemmatales bacterium]
MTAEDQEQSERRMTAEDQEQSERRMTAEVLSVPSAPAPSSPGQKQAAMS